MLSHVPHQAAHPAIHHVLAKAHPAETSTIAATPAAHHANRATHHSLGKPTPAGTSSVATAPIPAGTTNFDQIIGASATRSKYDVDGTGSSIAVIDTGVNYDNTDLGGGFGPGYKVIAGYDFADSSPDPIATTWQHGTSVAGLIAGDSSNDPGVAPGANIVALKVFNNQNASSFSLVADALQWVITNHSTYNITVVNLSLSDGGNYTQDWYTTGIGAQISSLIQQLDALNIPVVTATGNDFTGAQGEGFTAIVPGSLSVTATDANDTLASDAQRLSTADGGPSATVIAAPGVNLWAPVDGNNFQSVTGTSFATAITSGAVDLLQQIYVSRYGSLPTVAQLESWIQGGAVAANDPVTGLNIGQLSISGAAALIPTPPPIVAVSTPPPATTTTPTPAPSNIAYFFNGQAAGNFEADNSNSGWTSFFSLFSGNLNSLSGWGNTTQPAPSSSSKTA